jgi:hypothetical protein
MILHAAEIIRPFFNPPPFGVFVVIVVVVVIVLIVLPRKCARTVSPCRKELHSTELGALVVGDKDAAAELATVHVLAVKEMKKLAK